MDCNCISINQFDLSNSMRMLWQQHVFWTRLLIISILDDLPDKNATQNRLLQNPIDLGKLFGQFYGNDIQKIITDLLTEHLVLGAQLISAYKINNLQEIRRLNILWYENADKMTAAFASINPFYNNDILKEMLYTHLDLTKKEISLRVLKKFEEDIINFDQLEIEAINMADYFTCGIVNQFKTLLCNFY